MSAARPLRAAIALLLSSLLLAGAAAAEPSGASCAGDAVCSFADHVAEAESSDAALALLQQGLRGRRAGEEEGAASSSGERQALAADGSGAQSPPCPTVSVVENFNLTEYTRATWYIQAQQTVSYQDESQLKCVVATYDVAEPSPGKVPFFRGTVVDIYNYFEGGQPTADANGQPIATDPQLCGSVAAPAKLKVAPCFLPQFAGGDYFVIDVGVSPSSGEYEWAIVSGGNPTVQLEDGCTTNYGSTAYFNAGLWIFSRTPTLPEAQLQAAYEFLRQTGYTTSQLIPVNQTGCTYAGAYIKP